MALTDKDIQAIKDVVKVAVNEAVDDCGLVTKEDLKYLPTKDEFYGKMDEVMNELKTIREETTIRNNRIDNQEVRIAKIESQLDISPD